MALFQKESDKDENNEDGVVSVRKRRTRKKESPKPWGKKERLFVLIIILLTVGTSSFLAFSARNWKLPGLPRFQMPKFSFPFFSEQTIVLEGDQKASAKAQKVIADFKERTKDLSGVYGLYVLRLDNGSYYGVNENEIFQAASLIKLPVMTAMYIEAEEGSLDLDDKYSLKQSDKTAGSGSLSGKNTGYTLTFRELVHLMGKQSDNTAFTICRNLLGDEKIQEVIVKAGMTETFLEENETTPSDIGNFFESLWRANLVTSESRDEILESLTDTIYEDHLPAGIPEDIRVVHKYGREVHVVNDAGIVFTSDPSGPEALPPGQGQGRRPFIIVIMTKGVVEKEADEVFPELARIVYDTELY